MQVERLLVLNLARRPDRWVSFLQERELTRDWPWPEPERVDAIDGKLRRLPSNFRGGRGAYGCLLSWRLMLTELIASGCKSAVILEDDATFVPYLGARFRHSCTQLPVDWEVYLLGGAHVSRPKRIASAILQAQKTARTHGMLLNRVGMLAMLAALQPGNTHVDSLFMRYQKTSGKVYTADPFLVGQRAGYSDVTEQLAPVRFWNG